MYVDYEHSDDPQTCNIVLRSSYDVPKPFLNVLRNELQKIDLKCYIKGTYEDESYNPSGAFIYGESDYADLKDYEDIDFEKMVDDDEYRGEIHYGVDELLNKLENSYQKQIQKKKHNPKPDALQRFSVKNIRSKKEKITTSPIIYYWWFREKCINQLLLPLGKEFDKKKISYKKVGKEKYALLYIGKGKNGNARLVNYHILDSQNFHKFGVSNRRLSSLRQTLCGLLKQPMSKGKRIIDEFMDKNCLVEFQICSANKVRSEETKIISANYLPLNYQHTKEMLTPLHRKILRESKDKMRK